MGARIDADRRTRTVTIRWRRYAKMTAVKGACMEYTKKKFYLGKSGTIACLVSADGKRLLIEFSVDEEGLTKTGVNGLIDALKTVREKMVR